MTYPAKNEQIFSSDVFPMTFDRAAMWESEVASRKNWLFSCVVVEFHGVVRQGDHIWETQLLFHCQAQKSFPVSGLPPLWT